MNDNNTGYHGRRVVAENGDLFIPHMSLQLAMGIDGVNENIVRYSLADVIETENIDAFCGRLRLLKEAIRREFAKKPEEQRFLRDNEWGEKSLNDFLTAEKEYGMDFYSEGSSNYIGRTINRQEKGKGGLNNEIKELLEKQREEQ